MNHSYPRLRQGRLLHLMESQGIELAIVTQRPHVQWLTGCWFPWLFEPAAALTKDGRCLLVAPASRRPRTDAVDELVAYEAQWTATLRNDQRQASSAALLKTLDAAASTARLGVEFSSFPRHLAHAVNGNVVDIEPALYALRRRKDPDELSLMQKAIAATERMYARARQMIEPGVNELDVFSQLQAAAVEEFGEPMSAPAGNDYACNARGGPPRDRTAQAGELYILDLGPSYRGYFADNCRTIAVNGRETDEQHAAWERIASVFPMVEQTVRPGVSCREFYQQVQSHLDAHLPGSFDHHLGHGVGLFPHEAPHLNPNWDDAFEEGDVFTVEPGLYSPELKAGIRLENNYRVGESGVELLSDFSLEL